MVGRDTPEPIRSGRPRKTSHGEGYGRWTENPPALAVGSVNRYVFSRRSKWWKATDQKTINNRSDYNEQSDHIRYCSMYPIDLRIHFPWVAISDVVLFHNVKFDINRYHFSVFHMHNARCKICITRIQVNIISWFCRYYISIYRMSCSWIHFWHNSNKKVVQSFSYSNWN